MPVEADVRFLNIDLLLVGRFDREPLVAALGDDVFVLHEDAVFGHQKCLVLEVAAADLDLSGTLARLIKWVERLPRAARRSWAGASRRVFDIGIQGGLKPNDTRWTIPEKQVFALAKLGAEVALTVYGAEWKRRRALLAARRGPARARRPPRSWPAGAARGRYGRGKVAALVCRYCGTLLRSFQQPQQGFRAI